MSACPLHGDAWCDCLFPVDSGWPSTVPPPVAQRLRQGPLAGHRGDCEKVMRATVTGVTDDIPCTCWDDAPIRRLTPDLAVKVKA